MNPPNTKYSKHLYRIMSFERAAEIIKSKEMYFAHPSTWEDPYECVIEHKYSRAVFAQCWSKRAISDAMWRIYSPNKSGVRIATTKQRLEAALNKLKNNHGIDYKIRDVDYPINQNIFNDKIELLKNQLQNDYSFDDASEALYVKRRAFDYEDEIRVILFDENLVSGEFKSGIKIKIEPSEIITSIWIDPRASGELVEAYTYYFKNILNFNGDVKKSGLYKSPKE